MAVVERICMNCPRFVIATAAILVNVSGLSAQAESGSSCEQRLQDCFVSASEQRDSCLQTVAASSACTFSSLGALVAKRAQFTGVQLSPEEQGPAFLGPQIINRRCVNNFDTAWSASLVKGPLSQETINRLSKSLDECAPADSTTLPRP
jgi:hypothetical protein